MIRLLLIEDDPIIAKDLASTVQELGYEVLGICNNHQKALDALQTARPDLVICDIHLEGDSWDGIRLATEIRRLYNLPLIFLTAMTDPATIGRAAAVEPDAYLAKPFEERQLYAAIELAISKFARHQEPPNTSAEPLGELLPFIGGSFFIKEKKRLVKVSAADILWIKAEGVYTHLVTAQRAYLLSVNLGVLEHQLKSLHFVRVHRSYMVNFLAIDAIEEDVLYIGEERIPLGKSYRDGFYVRLQQLG